MELQTITAMKVNGTTHVVQHLFGVSSWQTESGTRLNDWRRRKSNDDGRQTKFNALTTECSADDANHTKRLSSCFD